MERWPGAARVIADRQAELAEEFSRAQMLEHQVLTEIQVDLAADNDVHLRAYGTALEQRLARGHLA